MQALHTRTHTFTNARTHTHAHARTANARTNTHLFPLPVFLDLCARTSYFTLPFCRTEMKTPQAFEPTNFPSQHFGRLHMHFPLELSTSCDKTKQRGGFECDQHHNSRKPLRPEHFSR